MMTDHDPIGYELTDLGADPDSHLYRVDSATRPCCGGIGGHTTACATETESARALRRHADSILMAATSAENAAADVALTPANARMLAAVLLAAALLINDEAVTR